MEGLKPILSHTLFSKFSLKQTVLVDLGGGNLEIPLLESAEKSNNGRYNLLHIFNIITLRLQIMETFPPQLESRLTEKLNHLYSVNPQDSSHFIFAGDNPKLFIRLFTKVSTKNVYDKSSTYPPEDWLSMNLNKFERIKKIFRQQSVED